MVITGEWILSFVHMGAIVEFWLTAFYYIYTEDYNKNPYKRKKKGTETEIKITKMNFYEKIEKAKDILFKNDKYFLGIWANNIRNNRNIIHPTNNKGITLISYGENILKLLELTDLILDRIPDIDY